MREPARRGDQSRHGGLVPVGDDPSIVLYDFRRPTTLSRDHVRVLQMAYETFARRLGTLLTSSLRAVCQVNLLDIEQHTYDEYITGLSTPTLLAPVTIKPMPGLGVLEFSVSSALACVDHVLGGPGGAQPQRTLTDIEASLIRDLIDKMIAVLTYALEPIAPLEMSLGALEFNPPFLQAAGSTDMMIISSFELRIGSEVGIATLCLPYAPFLPRLQTQRPQRAATPAERSDAAEKARALRAGLGDVPLDVTVRFEPVQLSADRILSLAAGDVVALPHRVDVPLAVQCGGVTYAQAIAGRDGSRLAAQVVGGPTRPSSSAGHRLSSPLAVAPAAVVSGVQA